MQCEVLIQNLLQSNKICQIYDTNTYFFSDKTFLTLLKKNYIAGNKDSEHILVKDIWLYEREYNLDGQQGVNM